MRLHVHQHGAGEVREPHKDGPWTVRRARTFDGKPHRNPAACARRWSGVPTQADPPLAVMGWLHKGPQGP